jgi:hypothetical protein
MNSTSATECLDNTIANMFESIATLALHYSKTSKLLIEVSDLPKSQRDVMIAELDQMETQTEEALSAVRKTSETPSARKAPGSWFRRFLN